MPPSARLARSYGCVPSQPPSPGRVGRGTGRPLLRRAGLGPLEALAQIAEERQAFYQDVADLVVDVDGLSSRQVARELLALLAPV